MLGETYAALLPGVDRRRSGTHYTPRDLTREVVAEALRPVLDRCGDDAGAVLSLRVCDPAMGCGAFLLEVCRQLGAAAGSKAAVARCCLYGVDLDPLAVELTRWSLWLEAGAEAAGLWAGDALMMDWSAAFPEAAGEGFDVVVGNPPFLGGNRISGLYGAPYLSRLRERFAGSHGSADLSAYFFRLGFGLLRPRGTLGLIATNSIYQGESRETGLGHVRSLGGQIYAAERRRSWPGAASVVVSVVWIHKGPWTGPRRLDGRAVERISSFLTHLGGEEAPRRLRANAGLASKGVDLGGRGFLVEPALRERFGAAVIRPYLGGADLNSSPTQSAARWVIDLSRFADEVPAAYQPLVARLASRRRSGRLAGLPCWQYERPRRGFFARLERAGLERVLVTARVSQTAAFCLVPSAQVFNEKVVVFLLDDHASFAVLQSRVHEAWARMLSSTMKDDLQYTLSRCFDNFPLPEGWTTAPALLAAGAAYHQHRAAVMVAADEGLTALYNRLHDPACADEDVVALRELHDDLDRAVLAAYGWDDLVPRCDFLLDYAIDEESWPPRRRKPFRYRWPDDLRDEVLTRLMALNRQRSCVEAEGG